MCILCDIAQGKAKSFKIYEDEDILAFLDIGPIREGHTLIIPKEHYEYFYDVPEDIFARMNIVAQKIAVAMKQIYKPLKVGTALTGNDIPHTHIHVIPMQKVQI